MANNPPSAICWKKIRKLLEKPCIDSRWDTGWIWPLCDVHANRAAQKSAPGDMRKAGLLQNLSYRHG
jgi:hypothetical protein